jgi:hypothetical protein
VPEKRVWSGSFTEREESSEGYGLLQAAEKVLVQDETLPQRLKPNSFQSICVRPKGRTLQKDEFFRSLFSEGYGL